MPALLFGSPPVGDEKKPKRKRVERFLAAPEQLSALERFNVRVIRGSIDSGWGNKACYLLQRYLGAGWIYLCIRNLLRVEGADRLPPLDDGRPILFVANHRSFFDMFVINTVAFRLGLTQRMLFPVRSGFFYDHPLGIAVNAVMSFLSMYPPIFRERKRLRLNYTAMSELIEAMRAGKSAGIHPEGTRNKGEDPYALLPGQSGVGRLIHALQPRVVPCFINGLGNDIVQQVKSNFVGEGVPIHVVFGAPVEFGALLDESPCTQSYQALTDRTMQAVQALAEEERALRAATDSEASG